jgi:hypothetical protein
MNKNAWQWLGHSLAVVAAAILLTGCAGEQPLGPDQPLAASAQLASQASARLVAAPAKASGEDDLAAKLAGCGNLDAPAGSKLAFRVYADGVQIYRWNGTGWSFDGPWAVLSADAQGNSTVGTHYQGPTWESASGGTLVGAILERCFPDPNAIPWLLLQAESKGPGVFHRVTHIQRVNTVGGNAPSYDGSVMGEEARVPYTAEYLFYRAR